MSGITEVFSAAAQWKKYGNGFYLTAASLVGCLVVCSVAASTTPVVVVHRASVAVGWTPLARYTGLDAPPIFRWSSPVLAGFMLAVALLALVWLALAPAVRALLEVVRGHGFWTWSDHLTVELNSQVWGRLSASVWFLLLIALQAGWPASRMLRDLDHWLTHISDVAVMGVVGYLVLWALAAYRADRSGSLLAVVSRFLMGLAPRAALLLFVSVLTVLLIVFFVPLVVFSWIFQRQSKQVVEAMRKLQERRARESVAQGARAIPPTM